MGLAHSPKVVTDGLVFYTDMGNTEKSWKGKPTTNVIENDISQFSSDNGCTIELQPHTFQGQPVYRVTFPSGTLPRIRTNFSYTTGQQFTGSIFYRVISAGSNTVNLIFRENNFGTTYTSTGLTSTVWVKTNISHTFSGSGTSMFLLYQSNSGAILPNVIDFCMPQVELSSFATPFVDGTRSNTQALLDMTGQNTVTATSLTYASDGSFSFNGTSDGINVSSNSVLNVGNNITVNAWFFVNSSTYQPIVSKVLSDGSLGWEIANSSGTFRTTLRPTNTQINLSAGTLTIGNWYMGTMTFDGVTARLYINGVQTGSTSTGGPVTLNSTQPLQIGTRGIGPNWYNGNIPQVSLYNRALSAEEVQQNFNALKGRYGL